MKTLLRFLNRMDASAWRAVIVTMLLLLSVIAVLAVGRIFLFQSDGQGLLGDVQGMLSSMRTSQLAFPLVVLIYCVLAFLGAPQFGLIGATVLAFGPVLGGFYAWSATLMSSSMAFFIGRGFGMGLVQRYGGDSILRLSRFMGRNDFLASAIVRNVPTAPAIVVNMAFGASEARFLNFLAGTALGIIPKTLLIVLFGQAIAESMSGNPLFAVGSVLVMMLIWIPLMLFARTNLRSKKDPKPAEQSEPEA